MGQAPAQQAGVGLAEVQQLLQQVLAGNSQHAAPQPQPASHWAATQAPSMMQAGTPSHFGMGGPQPGLYAGQAFSHSATPAAMGQQALHQAQGQVDPNMLVQLEMLRIMQDV